MLNFLRYGGPAMQNPEGRELVAPQSISLHYQHSRANSSRPPEQTVSGLLNVGLKPDTLLLFNPSLLHLTYRRIYPREY